MATAAFALNVATAAFEPDRFVSDWRKRHAFAFGGGGRLRPDRFVSDWRKRHWPLRWRRRLPWMILWRRHWPPLCFGPAATAVAVVAAKSPLAQYSRIFR